MGVVATLHQMLRFEVFATLIGIERVGDEWRVVYLDAVGNPR